VLYLAAIVQEILGNRAAAIKMLKAALSKGYPAESMQRDPDLRQLREDPAYRSLIK
jgi:hypothetical protein